MFTIQIKIMPLNNLLDPQGKAVQEGLKNLGMAGVNDVRIGKHITLVVDAASKEDAHALAEEACRKLLANPVMEEFEITVQ
ncbi:MAG: phosphoribosylformylglycinamidine synthase subunit PurS [Dinghuibacter sp.]|nr:phosphoribosylformylglycinamidine synthase subunit PurS [Dinghuibacter sp.]